MKPQTIPLMINSPNLYKILNRLGKDIQPKEIVVKKEGLQTFNDCFNNVKEIIKSKGGEIVYGWALWELPKILVEAEFHSVWKTENNELYDITPRGFEKTLFVPDYETKYEGFQIDNIRVPITNFQPIETLIKANEELFQLMNKGNRKFQHGRINDFTYEETLELKKIRQTATEALIKIQIRNSNPQRNSECICGSRKKYKTCCGMLQ